ncbi:hypothetical protein [Yersinia phage vB_YenM_P778]
MAEPITSWATEDVDPSGQQTRAEPPLEVQRTGLLKGEPMGRQWFNYLFWNILENLRGLAYASGDVRISTEQTPAWASDPLIWKYDGTSTYKDLTPTTPVDVTIYIFKKV